MWNHYLDTVSVYPVFEDWHNEIAFDLYVSPVPSRLDTYPAWREARESMRGNAITGYDNAGFPIDSCNDLQFSWERGNYIVRDRHNRFQPMQFTHLGETELLQVLAAYAESRK